MRGLLLHTLVCIFLSSHCAGLMIRFEELARTYDSTERPKIRDAVQVNVTLLINTLEMDEARQMVRMTGELQQEWEDIRLRFSSATNHEDSIGLEGKRGERLKAHLWLPDLTIAEGYHFTSVVPKDFLIIENDGHLIWIQQVFYEFPCEYDYKVYPLGYQECTIKLQSLGYEYLEVDPRWANDEAVLYQNTFVSHRYTIEEVEYSAVTVVTIHKAKRQLQALLILEVNSEWTVKHMFLPFVAAVATAYLACFIKVSDVTARMVLCSAAFIMATVFNESIFNQAPQSSATMAVEVFSATCFTFIWIAVAESVVADIIANLHAKTGSHNFNGEEADLRGYTAALWLDRIFMILYPAVFLAFNAVFWIMYYPYQP